MELQIQGKNLELNDGTRDYITRKVNRLVRHLPRISTVVVELTRQNTREQDSRVIAQVTLDIDGTVLRGEEREANAMAAVDSVIDVLDRRIERYKGRVYNVERARRTGQNVSIRTMDIPTIPPDEDSADDEVVEAGGKVVRVKRYPIKPMTVDEAAFQMELLGHDFFLFLDSEMNQFNLLYKRRDGDYSLIQPEPL